MTESQDSLAEEGIFFNNMDSDLMPIPNEENGSQDFELIDNSEDFLAESVPEILQINNVPKTLPDEFLEPHNNFQKDGRVEDAFEMDQESEKPPDTPVDTQEPFSESMEPSLYSEMPGLKKRKLSSPCDYDAQDTKRYKLKDGSSDFETLALESQVSECSETSSLEINPTKISSGDENKNVDSESKLTLSLEQETDLLIKENENDKVINDESLDLIPVVPRENGFESMGTDNGEKTEEDLLQKESVPVDDAPKTNSVDEIIEDETKAESSIEIEPIEGEEPHNNQLDLNNSLKSRTSIEVIYENSPHKRMKSGINYNQEAEEIVLDSSREDSKTEKLRSDENIGDIKSSFENIKEQETLCNSAKTSQEPISDSTISNTSDSQKADKADQKSDAEVNISDILARLTKAPEIPVVNDNDSSLLETNGFKNPELFDTESLKSKNVERTISINLKVKCVFNVDETTKEIYRREIISCSCDHNINISSNHHNEKIIDSSGGLGDVSDNKDHSPSSVLSDPRLFKLNPRHSTFSILSSSSSGSSVPATRLLSKDKFSVPQETNTFRKNCENLEDKLGFEAYDRLNKEWKNTQILINAVRDSLDHASLISIGTDTLEEPPENLHSSTPEAGSKKKPAKTPRSTKSDKAVKRLKSKSSRFSNDSTKKQATPAKKKLSDKNATPIIKEKSSSRLSDLSDQMEQEDHHQLLGKDVFAKWADNKYYPGKVIGMNNVKTKYKVKFCDGFEKDIVPDFIVPIQDNMNGYAVETIVNKDYQLPGIIIDTKEKNKKPIYVLDTAEGQIERSMKDLYLTVDQAKVLKEDSLPKNRSAPPTPQHLSHVVLENLVEGKRRPRRTDTPRSTKLSRGDSARASSSGTSSKKTRAQKKLLPYSSENNDSDFDDLTINEDDLLGVQSEIIGTDEEPGNKGLAKKIKGVGRNRKKQEPKKDIEKLGPIPEEGSNIFKDISFILSCSSKDSIDRYKYESPYSNSEHTEDEDEWLKRPFDREHLENQIRAGGGKFYENFEAIPPEEYSKTMHITNLPNRTQTSLLCLSVGIRSYKHDWVIRKCQDQDILPESEELPAGYSIKKKKYVESYRRTIQFPLEHSIISIPSECGEKFTSFWKTVCQNAGAKISILNKPGDMLEVTTAIIANKKCPAWVIEDAKKYKTRVYSTMWITQCLIEGNLIDGDDIEDYKIFK